VKPSVKQTFELIHIEDDALFGMGEGVVAQELKVRVSIERTVLGIDNPDFGDAHCPVVFQFPLEPLYGVFGRKNFKDSKRGWVMICSLG
jgi:hypothetical protein